MEKHFMGANFDIVHFGCMSNYVGAIWRAINNALLPTCEAEKGKFNKPKGRARDL